MKTLYKKQMRKAFSRGLRGMPNNVPGQLGKIFHRIGKQVAKGVELDYVKVEDTAAWSNLAISLLRWCYHDSKHEVSVLHGSKFYTLDLTVFFWDFNSIKDRIK
jgi:hypothetical protein